MNIEYLTSYCLSLEKTNHDFPFGPDVMVFKVLDKVFAITDLSQVPGRINLKCDPEEAIKLREAYPEQIIPGFHMNKKHWNTVYYENFQSDFVKELILNSYHLVIQKMTKKQRRENKL